MKVVSPDHDVINMFICESVRKHRRPHTGIKSLCPSHVLRFLTDQGYQILDNRDDSGSVAEETC
jgi:hypothetical protein